MNIPELKNTIMLIQRFTLKMDREDIPVGIQRILLKIYANTLKINLTDKMIDDILHLNLYSTSKYTKVHEYRLYLM